MSTRLTALPRAAVLLPVATDWQPVVSFELSADRKRLLKQATAALDGRIEIVEGSVVASTQEAADSAERALHGGAELVLVVASMAVLPSVPLAALDRLAGLPVVIWALHQNDHLGTDTGHEEIVVDGGTVGATMLASLLVRAGRPSSSSWATSDDPDAIERVESALAAGAGARRISTARIGRVGLPVAGYDCVDLDEDRLRESIGVSIIRLDPQELARTYSEVPEAAVMDIVEETRSLYSIDPTLLDDDLFRAARAAAALEQLVDDHDLDAGALTCHVEGIRFEPGLGFAPCYALGRMTSRGVPWSCSSDVPAVMAMLTLKVLGAAAQYHELEIFDPDSGEFLVASSGEHDLAFAGDARPRLVANGWFPGDTHRGVCACFGPTPGPATLLGFAQLDAPEPAHRFVIARGTFGSRSFERVATPHASFRFAGSSPAAAWTKWCRAGVSLHAAATPGDLEGSVESIGRLLGVEVVSV